MRATFDPPTDPSAYPFVQPVRVRFAETDAMGVVHHAAYLPYLEDARVAYLRSVGHPYTALRDDGVELPVVQLAVRYLRPLYFDDLVQVHLVPASVRGATFQIGYLLAVDGQARATAVTVHGITAQGRPARAPDWLAALAR
ncbi:MAG TPA: thioesterase family protein [Acidimicrobiales bacterium]|nr:thioesterase family protein [Acidimicrobiales bacterium]